MDVLPSGLPKLIADEEDLARFLVSSGQYNSSGARHTAFLPNPKDHETSVSRHGAQPKERLWALAADLTTRERSVHGAALVKAGHVRKAKLDAIADEPPDRHAAIRGWPWDWADPDLQRARHKEMALVIASESLLVWP